MIVSWENVSLQPKTIATHDSVNESRRERMRVEKKERSNES